MATKNSFHARICELVGIPETDDKAAMIKALEALKAKADAAEPETEATMRSNTRRPTVIHQRTPTYASSGSGDGVKIMSKTDAEDAYMFGAADDLQRRQIIATEDRFGKSLADCLRAGLLRDEN